MPAPPCSSMLSRARSMSTGFLCHKKGQCYFYISLYMVRGWLVPCSGGTFPASLMEQATVVGLDGWCQSLHITIASWITEHFTSSPFEYLKPIKYAFFVGPDSLDGFCLSPTVVSARQQNKWFIIHSFCRETDIHLIPALGHTQDVCYSKDLLKPLYA